MSGAITANILREESIARAVAAGERDEDICALFDLTPHALSSLRAKPSFENAVSAFREKAVLAIQMRERIALQLDAGAFRIVEEDMMGAPGKARSDTARWWLGLRMAKSRHEGAVNVNVGVGVSTGDALANISKVLDGLAEAKLRGDGPTIDISADPHLHDA